MRKFGRVHAYSIVLCALVQWLLEVRLFERVLSAIDVRESEWVHANAAQVACEAIRIVRENAALLLPERGASASSGGLGMGMGMGNMGMGNMGMGSMGMGNMGNMGMGMVSTPPSAMAGGANNGASLAKLEQLLDHVHSYARSYSTHLQSTRTLDTLQSS